MSEEIRIELAILDDTDGIIQMMAELHQQMEDKTWFYPDKDEDVRWFLEESGFALKAMHGDEMIGFFFGYAPGTQRENMGVYLNLPEEELKRAAHMETAMIIPEFRGRGLQKLLMETAEQIFKKKGYVHMFGTVHPDNIYSVRNFEKQGYRVVTETRKYGGLRRYVCYKNLE